MATFFNRSILLLLAVLLWGACGSEKSISERVALSKIADYIEMNPLYDTADIDYGKIKFSLKSDSALLAAYQRLEQSEYITLERLKERKKFLSKDSTLIYLAKLTDKSIPFVRKKTDKKATVKTFEYTLDKEGGVLVEQTGKNRAKATVTLRKVETDFADFAKKATNNNASFIKKTYSLRRNAETGWEVTK